jgi:hypothetical protein
MYIKKTFIKEVAVVYSTGNRHKEGNKKSDLCIYLKHLLSRRVAAMKDIISGKRLKLPRYIFRLNYQSTTTLLNYRIGNLQVMWIAMGRSTPAAKSPRTYFLTITVKINNSQLA